MRRFDNHFDNSRKVFEEMFIYSGFYGCLILFMSVFYDAKVGDWKLGNAGLLYADLFFAFTLFDVYRKLYKDVIKLYSTLRLVVYCIILLAIFLVSVLGNSFGVFSFLNIFSRLFFTIFTLFLLVFAYILYYYRWKSNTYKLSSEIIEIEILINQFSNISAEYINSKIRISL